MAVTPELKKALVAAGFEVYRTSGDDVILADRARENLILDSGVRVRTQNGSAAIQVRLIMGIRRAQFPSDDEATLFDRVRQLASPLLSEGFAEVATGIAPVVDPADSQRTLDTFYEVVFAKDAPAVEAAVGLLKLALKVAKTAESRH
jgi:hypothetical protein